jgi:hypothetical protein
MKQNSTKEANIAFKGALGRNKATEEMSGFGVLNLDVVEFLSDGLKQGSDELVGGEVQHDSVSW